MKRALIVDDALAMRKTIEATFVAQGYSCVLADSADSAAKILSSNNADFDVITIDWHMPGEITGLQFVEKVRESSSCANSLVYMVSSECDESLMAQAKDAGVNDFIKKPFTRADLEKVIT